EVIIGIIVFAAKQIIQQFEKEGKDHEKLTNELEGIVAQGIDDNRDKNLLKYAIEPKHFTNGNDRLRKNDSGTQLQASVNDEANPEINVTKISANTPPLNVNGSDGLLGNGCGTQSQAVTNENGYPSHHSIDNNCNANDKKLAKDWITSHNPYLKRIKKFKHFLIQKLAPLIIIPPNLGQVKGKVVVPKQSIQSTNDHDTNNKSGQQKSVPNKSLGILEARANSDTSNHFTLKYELKKGICLPVTEDKSAKQSKSNKTGI
ncbi:MAG: hypothetical protein EZS28_047882, partial [Streblomastix strix]